jgi:hypothetical protein
MISHYDLCKKTAEKFIKQSKIVLFEYQSFATNEFPDVLCFKDSKTTLFEIKVNYQDFKKDNQKDCRIKYRLKYFPSAREHKRIASKIKFEWKSWGLSELIQQAPHLGRHRYYVCPAGLIQKDEVENGWGLYWYDGKFKKKKESKIFRPNMYEEMRILEHAFRKHACGDGKNILINKYKESPIIET